MQSAECRVQSADFRLQMRGGGQQSADCKSAECRGLCQSTEPLPQQSADCKSAECRGLCQSTEPLPQQSADCKSAECRGLCQSTEPLPQQSAESCEQIEISPLHYHITEQHAAMPPPLPRGPLNRARGMPPPPTDVLLFTFTPHT